MPVAPHCGHRNNEGENCELSPGHDGPHRANGTPFED